MIPQSHILDDITVAQKLIVSNDMASDDITPAQDLATGEDFTQFYLNRALGNVPPPTPPPGIGPAPGRSPAHRPASVLHLGRGACFRPSPAPSDPKPRAKRPQGPSAPTRAELRVLCRKWTDVIGSPSPGDPPLTPRGAVTSVLVRWPRPRCGPWRECLVLAEAREGSALGARRALKDRCGPGPEGLRREAGPPLVRPATGPRAEPGREGRRPGRWRPLRFPGQSLRVTFETFPQKEKQLRCASPVSRAPRPPVLRTCDPAVWLKESTMSGNTMIVSNVEKSSVNIHVLRHTELRMERTLMRIISQSGSSTLHVAAWLKVDLQNAYIILL
nr:PREDICTED: uncharacterized protein LOC103561685 [Equus przewalskii]